MPSQRFSHRKVAISNVIASVLCYFAINIISCLSAMRYIGHTIGCHACRVCDALLASCALGVHEPKWTSHVKRPCDVAQ